MEMPKRARCRNCGRKLLAKYLKYCNTTRHLGCNREVATYECKNATRCKHNLQFHIPEAQKAPEPEVIDQYWSSSKRS